MNSVVWDDAKGDFVDLRAPNLDARPKWQPDDIVLNCTSCSKEFSFFVRKVINIILIMITTKE